MSQVFCQLCAPDGHDGLSNGAMETILTESSAKMIATLIRIRPANDEPYDAFCQRRHIVTGKKASKSGRWSESWARSVHNWAAHVDRKHDNRAWSHILLGWRGGFWLEMQRFIKSRGRESRTRTRTVRGKVQRRWEEGLQEARTVSEHISA